MNTNNFPDDKRKNKKRLLNIAVLKSLAFYKTKTLEIKNENENSISF